jgi:hypothetical protein
MLYDSLLRVKPRPDTGIGIVIPPREKGSPLEVLREFSGTPGSGVRSRNDLRGAMGAERAQNVDDERRVEDPVATMETSG